MSGDLTTGLIVIVPVALLSAALLYRPADELGGEATSSNPGSATEGGVNTAEFALDVLILN